MSVSTFAVYPPPSPGLPYLAVMLTPGGIVCADAFATASLAEAHNRKTRDRIVGTSGAPPSRLSPPR